MAQDLSFAGMRSRRLQSMVILLAAIAQIVCARLTDFLNVGIDVELRSAVNSHPLVPLSPAFAIWGAIYLFSLVAAIWQILPAQRYNRALTAVGWNMAAIYLIDAVWEVWVPLKGFDTISSALVLVALIIGIVGLLRLRQDMVLVRNDEVMVFAPLALVSGWLTAACFINFTTVLVSGGYALDPTYVNVSLGFLIGLILFAGVMAWLVESLVYSGALVWALAWILLANIYRDTQPAMVTTSLAGVALVGLISVWAVTHSHESEPMHLRRG